VLSPPTPGAALLLLDAPSAGHAAAAPAALAASPALTAALAAGRLAVVLHLSPAEVAACPAYEALRDALRGAGRNPPTHVLANEAAAGQPCVLRASALLQLRLAALAPQLHPQPALCGAPAPPDAAGALAGDNMMRWRLRPLAAAGVCRAAVPPRLVAQPLLEALAAEAGDARSLAAAAVDGWAAACAAPGLPPAVARLAAAGRAAAPRLLFLGTGAAIPSKYRNVSGILFSAPGRGCALLDCGEGSLGQLRRYLGAAGAAEALRTLRCAWVSHIHADHHMGLLAVLAARRAALGGDDAPPLLVVGPAPLRRLRETHGREVEPRAAAFVDLADTTGERLAALAAAGASPPPHWPLYGEALAELGLARLQAVPVVHCAHAYAAVLEEAAPAGQPPWKLVYSGDTRPCDALAAAAAGACLLVHEATFEDALADEAVAKRHSLTREAVEMGARAGAYRTLLTHFSQRYPKTPTFDDSFADSTGIAFDSLSLSLADLPALPSLMPALRVLFPERAEEEADEEGKQVDEE
jgi:ribonuclease Z